MTQQTHKQKVKLARNMRTNKEIQNGINIFDSAEWNKRTEARRKKLKKQMKKITKEQNNEDIQKQKRE